MSLAEKLVNLRKQKGMTQMELAGELHVSRQAISRWEVGAAVPSTDNLMVLSELYGVSLDCLLYDDEEKPSIEYSVQKPNEKDGKDRRKILCRYIGVGIVVLVMVVVITTLVMILQNQRNDLEQVMPIGEMDTIVEDDYTVHGFSFG